ncbi:acyl-CoA dehydrogenase-like protein [Jatrophihabitans sp. GAS493]|uniref:acyl-CoA dehydrogenase family protein n=1 Tax=Jatrophihabitans sp. GAS493 TaxID=1907575 RepID=UPI000BC04C45|nr:acyl-CoA dehydrogenase family protein [Jatrophihabitans sp. GAS493]SOD71796.1 acyl-CoA dehydrogenase-like protein [Jatrophihabitans sp. GAS493]
MRDDALMSEQLMSEQERGLFAELATELLSNAQAETLIEEIVDSGMGGQVWSDPLALAALFETHGRYLAASPLLDYAALRPPAALAARLVLPGPGRMAAPARLDGDLVVVDGIVLAASAADAGASASASKSSGYALATRHDGVLLVGGAGLVRTPSPGFDPDLEVCTLRGSVERSAVTSVLDVDWDDLRTRLARALAFELLGIAAEATRRAVQHVGERQQFGRPLAAFQVVRHRLAEVEIARMGAWELASATDDTLPADTAVNLIKAAAGRAALAAVAQAQQVCGGMGFTAEFGLHRLVRRAYLLDSLLGGCEAAEVELGAQALSTGLVPQPLVAL